MSGGGCIGGGDVSANSGGDAAVGGSGSIGDGIGGGDGGISGGFGISDGIDGDG